MQRLDRGEVPLVAYLFGEDDGRILFFTERIVQRCLEGSVREFNLNLLDARDAPMERVLEVVQTHPVLSNWRVVQVRNCSLFGKADWTAALPYLKDPSPTTCLIFRGEKPSCPKEVIDAIQARGALLEFRPRTERQAERWLAERIAREGKRIQPEAARVLVQRVGTREGDLERESEKLLIYLGEGTIVREEHVHELSVEARTHRVFDLTDALVEKRTKDALFILHRLLEEGSSPLGLVGMMARQVRLIWLARGLKSQGKRITGWPERFPVPPFLKNRLLMQAKKWDDVSLSLAHEGLVKIDQTLKRGRMDPEILLDQWVLSLANRTNHKHPRG